MHHRNHTSFAISLLILLGKKILANYPVHIYLPYNYTTYAWTVEHYNARLIAMTRNYRCSNQHKHYQVSMNSRSAIRSNQNCFFFSNRHLIRTGAHGEAGKHVCVGKRTWGRRRGRMRRRGRRRRGGPSPRDCAAARSWLPRWTTRWKKNRNTSQQTQLGKGGLREGRGDGTEGENGGVDEREKQHIRRLPFMLRGAPHRRRIADTRGRCGWVRSLGGGAIGRKWRQSE